MDRESARPNVKIAWLSYLDSHVFEGGAELAQRRIILAGRERGHIIGEAPFLRHRTQRAMRRTGLYRSVDVDWSADVFVLANMLNCPHLAQRFPSELTARALATGRAVAFEDAWVDVCPLDVPCGGDRAACPPHCDRSFGNALFAAARAAVFVSPLHRDIVASVLDCPLPDDVVLVRPMVDPDHFRPRDVERDIDVLYVGTINEAKGYYELLERFGPDRLTLAGDNHLGHPAEGTFLGRVSQHDLPALYSRARIFAHLPRWHEPQGRAVVEAALCGCEVVTNERVGVTRYPRAAWSDAETIRTHPTRFWEEFERAVTVTASA